MRERTHGKGEVQGHGDGHQWWPVEEAESELGIALAKWRLAEKEMLRRLPARGDAAEYAHSGEGSVEERRSCKGEMCVGCWCCGMQAAAMGRCSHGLVVGSLEEEERRRGVAVWGVNAVEKMEMAWLRHMKRGREECG